MIFSFGWKLDRLTRKVHIVCIPYIQTLIGQLLSTVPQKHFSIARTLFYTMNIILVRTTLNIILGLVLVEWLGDEVDLDNFEQTVLHFPL